MFALRTSGLESHADQKLAIYFEIFLWKCPLQNEYGLALSKMKFQACHLSRQYKRDQWFWSNKNIGFFEVGSVTALSLQSKTKDHSLGFVQDEAKPW